MAGHFLFSPDADCFASPLRFLFSGETASLRLSNHPQFSAYLPWDRALHLSALPEFASSLSSVVPSLSPYLTAPLRGWQYCCLQSWQRHRYLLLRSPVLASTILYRFTLHHGQSRDWRSSADAPETQPPPIHSSTQQESALRWASPKADVWGPSLSRFY